MAKNAARSSGSTNTNTTDNATERSRMSFGDHLDELRSCLIRALAGVVIASIVALYYGKEILQIIYAPLLIVQYRNGLSPQLLVLAPTAAFVAYLKIGILSGLILSMPWVIHQIWRFVATGLYIHERRFVRLLVPASAGLFATGVLFLYFIVLPLVLHFFISFNKAFEAPALMPTAFQRLLLPEPELPEATPEMMESMRIPVVHQDPGEPKNGDIWINVTTRRLIVHTGKEVLSVPLETGPTTNTMNSQFAIDFYVSFVLMLALAFGIAFETPIVVFFLAWSGLVSTRDMRRGRRYVLLGTVMTSAMLTPPDVISQLLLAVPMYLLFELGILVARFTERKTEMGAG